MGGKVANSVFHSNSQGKEKTVAGRWGKVPNKYVGGLADGEGGGTQKRNVRSGAGTKLLLRPGGWLRKKHKDKERQNASWGYCVTKKGKKRASNYGRSPSKARSKKRKSLNPSGKPKAKRHGKEEDTGKLARGIKTEKDKKKDPITNK